MILFKIKRLENPHRQFYFQTSDFKIATRIFKIQLKNLTRGEFFKFGKYKF